MEGQICDPARSPGCRASATWVRSPEHSPCRRGPNRSRVLDRTPHCYSLLCIVIFRCFSLLFARAGTPGKSAQSRAAQGEIRRRVQRPHCYFIVINNAAVRERRARHQATPHDIRPRTGARCRSGQDAGQHPRPVRRCPLHDVKQPGPRTRGNASCLRAPRGTVGPRDRLRKTTSNANLSSIITLSSQQ